MLAVTTAASAFLGAAAINHGGLRAWGVLALASFAVAIGCCLAALWPHRAWTFYEGAAKLVSTYCETPHPEGGAWTSERMQSDLALHMEQHADGASATMKGIQQWFMSAGIGLTGEVALAHRVRSLIWQTTSPQRRSSLRARVR